MLSFSVERGPLARFRFGGQDGRAPRIWNRFCPIIIRRQYMSVRQISCTKHGAQGLAIACIHVCLATDSGENVGFFWSTATDGPRPDAWCSACELWFREHPNATTKEWMKVADFKFLCVHCWDEAKQVQRDRG
jgi:hypothetical protein